MDLREKIRRLGDELARAAAAPTADPASLVRYGLARLAVIARDAGLGCRVAVDRDHREVDLAVDAMRARDRAAAEAN